MRMFLRGAVAVAAAWLSVAITPASMPTGQDLQGAFIIGSIVDDALTPLPKATVTLSSVGSKHTATTDGSGGFEFTNVGIGEYVLQASRDGHTPVTKSVTIRSAPDFMRLGLVMARPGAALPMADDIVAVTGGAVPPGQAWLPQGGPGRVFGRVTDTSDGALPGVTVLLSGGVAGNGRRLVTDQNGDFQFDGVPVGGYHLTFQLAGFVSATRGVDVGERPVRVDQSLSVGALSETVTVRAGTPIVDTKRTSVGLQTRGAWQVIQSTPGVASSGAGRTQDTATYAGGQPNRFVRTADDPRSTFAADVDTASYTNVRRFISEGRLPPVGAVRVEEFVNYFTYDYPDPSDGRPIAIASEIGESPWSPGHKLVLVGAQARGQARELPGRNLVFLVDVSGSMQSAERLPMLRSALALFVDSLRPDDEVSIVTYAGTSGVWLPPTTVRHRDRIQQAIASLRAGGSTNGHSGLTLAYRLARQQFIPGGVNRVLLATDGDFNVGVTSNMDLLSFIERERKSGVFLSVLGVGTHNLQDDRMEMLADKGNGHYAYLDSLQEANRVLVREAASTLETVAQDVKFQVEFNPATVQGYRLIGYENRRLEHREFNDDTVDAGDVGDGHSVTVLYEIVPVGAPWPTGPEAAEPGVDPLRYQGTPTLTQAARGNEWLTVRVRYQPPGGGPSELISHAVRSGERGAALPFAAAVAEFGMLLRETDGPVDRWERLRQRARVAAEARGGAAGERAGFAELVELAAGLRRVQAGR